MEGPRSYPEIGPLFKKSHYRERAGRVWSFYCPNCRAPRRVGIALRPQPMHYVQIALTAVFLTMVTWPWLAGKGWVSVFPLWVGFEAIYRVRARAQLHCDDCGFDPYLYLVDAQRAKTEIEAHWRKKFAERGIPYPEKGQGANAAPTAAGKGATPAEATAESVTSGSNASH